MSWSNHSEEDDFDERWTHQKKREWLKSLLLHRQKECLLKQYIEAAANDTHEGWCPRVWDQMLCWAPTPRNTTVFLLCPPFVPGLNAERFL
ncbi:vasoactive intestinal polypeptide receptor 1-like [Penaeus monodon]|uniref:vasoactive intestinal polypeptide receptor 1-like n=1 Tax=Penaeus monodon TaxID=6687 RepID=UPI0018A78896|nr:vasoactive intestinal polypeptide receptor 1-like [Penaeus monodon]